MKATGAPGNAQASVKQTVRESVRGVGLHVA